jgi:transporter family protein
MIRKTGFSRLSSHCPASSKPGILGAWVRARTMTDESRQRKLPSWLLWSLASIVLWGVWGLVSKVASEGVDAYVNQLLYTVGLAPLMVFVAWTVHRRDAAEPENGPGKNRKDRLPGISWAFLTGILGGVGNLAFFQALVKGGKASVVAPVTALFPMVTVVLALIFLKERLGRVQWVGLGLAFVAIYLLSA